MLLDRVKLYIQTKKLLQPHSTVIVGLSGGPDSVFLLYALKALEQELNLTLIAAHLDHQWRANSSKDALFCQQIAQRLNIPCIVRTACQISLDKKYNGSQEELGRNLRRSFFEHLAHEYNAHTVALAHHADDQQETFFIRLLRGATLSGLASIRALHGMYIRPLLSVTKSEILAYLHEHSITYTIDPTNDHTTYLRNRLRSQVLPTLKLADNRFDTNFTKTLQHIQDTENFLERLTTTAFLTITKKENNTVILSINLFLACDEFLQPRLLLSWLCSMGVPFRPSTGFFKELTQFLKQPGPGSHTFYGKWSVIKKSNQAYIQDKK
ncbi:tRNA lysidine(34) synthetase TilS [Candidatus Dependentiae bacterium]|nr:tRNA lysidine(34) synthetase TilS [Candidatus Dependentiae bacterium]